MRSPPVIVNSSTNARASRVSVASARRPGMSISTLMLPVFARMAPSFIFWMCCLRMTDLSPVAVTKMSPIGDIFVTATGDTSVIRKQHIQKMKDGAILANTGNINVEIDIPGLRALATDTREARAFVEEFTMTGGERIYLIADGRLVNLSAAEGHPALVMDMSFANQALSAEYAIQNAAELERKVYPVPVEIDKEIARLKLATMGVEIDTLTEEQEKYLASWDEGT